MEVTGAAFDESQHPRDDQGRWSVWGTTDRYVYHRTPYASHSFEQHGIKPSERGYGGPGVYMGIAPEVTLDYAEGNLLRIDKQKLIERFGKYPETNDGVEYDDGTGEVILTGHRSVPPEFVDVQTADGGWKPLVKRVLAAFDETSHPRDKEGQFVSVSIESVGETRTYKLSQAVSDFANDEDFVWEHDLLPSMDGLRPAGFSQGDQAVKSGAAGRFNRLAVKHGLDKAFAVETRGRGGLIVVMRAHVNDKDYPDFLKAANDYLGGHGVSVKQEKVLGKWLGFSKASTDSYLNKKAKWDEGRSLLSFPLEPSRAACLLARAIRNLSNPNHDAAGRFAPTSGDRQTATVAFKNWFGTSKVIDEHGNPLVVYKSMYPYDYTKETETDKGPLLETIARPSPFPSFNTDEPGVQIAGFFGDRETANIFSEIGHGVAIYPVYLSLQHPFVIDNGGRASGMAQFGPEGKPFRDAVRSGQYDGAIIKNTFDEGTVYVAFKPEQIKSAIGNTGKFDPKSPLLTAFDASQARDEHGRWTDAGLGEPIGRKAEVEALDNAFFAVVKSTLPEPSKGFPPYDSSIVTGATLSQRAQMKETIVHQLSNRMQGSRSERDLRAQIADDRLHDWANSSGDHESDSVRMQYAVAQVFEIEQPALGHLDKINPSTVTSNDRKFVQAEYEATQQFFKDAGITHVSLFRGVVDLDLPEGPQTVTMQPASSWTTSLGIAKAFAKQYQDSTPGTPTRGHILVTRVPVSRILSTAVTGRGALSESEVIMLGGPLRVHAVDVKKGGSLPMRVN